MPQLFLGVDAGHTKTVALVSDARGHVLGSGRSQPGVVYEPARPKEAVDVVALTVTQAMASAGAQLSEVHCAAFRLAGIDWPEDETYWRAELGRRFAPIGLVSVKNDGFALLRCGDLSGIGVAVVAGTGHAVAGRGPEAQEFALGWWGQHYLGGAALGRDALRAVFLAELGMGAPTLLTAALLEVYAATDVAGLLHLFTRREDPLGEADRSRAACAVLQVAEASDAVAVQILDRQATLLADYSLLVARKVGLVEQRDDVDAPYRSLLPSSTLQVVLGGSVLASDHAGLRDRLIADLSGRLPCAHIGLGVGGPVVGALFDALAEGGTDLGPAVRDRVLATR